jgi:hypothetical protein
MSGHTVVHRAPGVSLRAHVLNDHLASIKAWRVGEKREAIAALLFVGRRIWETEEAARHGRRRSLIDDNPTAG